MSVGWIGLGNMGLAMAGHVHSALKAQSAPPLVYTNRTLYKGAELERSGAVPVKTVGQVVERSDIIFSSMSNDAIVEAAIDEAIASGHAGGKVFCDFSTLHYSTARRLSDKLQSVGAAFVAAPVFGSTSVAQSAGLVVVAAGPDAAIESILPYLQGVIARAVIRMGPDPESSCKLKITGNSILVSLAEIVSSAHVLAEKAGVENAALEQLLNLMFNGGPMLNYSQRVTSGGYAPGPGKAPSFGIDLAIKDAGYALGLAAECGAKMPVVEVAKGHLERAREEQGSNLDSTAIYGVLREDAGLSFASSAVDDSGRVIK